MSFIADTHVHLYPVHEAATLLTGAYQRLAALAPGLPCVLCLTERAGCEVFRDWSTSPEHAPAGFLVRPAGDAALQIQGPGGLLLYLVAGRQLATAERLEVHCLGRDTDLPDGLSTVEAIERVRTAGGIPAIPWGIGKWLGARGRLVREVVARHPGVWLGDSSLRPSCWPESCFRRAASRVLAGSDPLPAAGEEHQAGRLASRFESAFDPADPARALRSALSHPASVRPVGSHSGPLEVWRRQQAMKRAVR